jgi:hypothetical protein
MNLKEYFENQSGIGVLATANSDGKVDTAIYSKPHVIDEETIAFIMADRLTHANLRSNPYASYLFKESGEGYVGKRLYLRKIKEESDRTIIDSFLRDNKYKDMKLFLVYFQIEKELPLVGE